MRKALTHTSGPGGGQSPRIPVPIAKRQGPKPDPARELKEVVAVVREGDGLDPRDEAKRKLRAAKVRRPGLERGTHRKERFANQVQEAVETALQLAAEPLLNALTVQEVVEHGGSLLVVAGPRETTAPLDVHAATRALKKASPMLAREVAHAITRKVTPNLTYIVLPAGAQRVEP